MASASVTTRRVEDMFWGHIENDSCMRGKWFYFGTQWQEQLPDILTVLPRWKYKKKLVAQFHAALMDKQKYVRSTGGRPWKDRQNATRRFFVASRDELPPWMGTQNVTTWICFGMRDERGILPNAVLTEDKKILWKENDPAPKPTSSRRAT